MYLSRRHLAGSTGNGMPLAGNPFWRDRSCKVALEPALSSSLAAGRLLPSP